MKVFSPNLLLFHPSPSPQYPLARDMRVHPRPIKFFFPPLDPGRRCRRGHRRRGTRFSPYASFLSSRGPESGG